ncbi:integral membrane [Fusarium agapanthi]|uniref:Integral membrane n=1 Tax=Fusarium agapanthi TaxID=1803897 RepID=A0A9P5E3S3_9HYPO|nr:integral membrane [Fusarium agapanthi]
MISEDIPSESNAVLIYAPSITFFIVTPIFILFRFWDRVARRSSLGWDDTTIIISFSSALTVQTVMVVSCNYGFGRHIEALTTDDKLMALKSKPLRGAWDKSIQSTCISLNKNWHANAGFSIGTDALILVLPMQPIWISQLPIAHKRALTMVLTMGGGVDIHRAHDNSRSGN